MLRVRIGGAGDRRNVRPCHMQQRRAVSRCALKVVMVAELFLTGDRVPDSWCRDTECLGLEVDPCRRLRVVVDWRISEYELVDDNEARHVDKPVILFSEFYM